MTCPLPGLDLTPARRRNRLAWVNTHVQWRRAEWRTVRLFTDESRFQLHIADGRQRIWRRTGERYADACVVRRVAHGGGGVLVWAGISHGHRTQLYFVEGNLNAVRYRDEILRPIVIPFVEQNYLILQQDNARPHVARVCMNFLEAENIRVLEWPAYSPDLSPIEHIWDILDRRVRHRVPLPANIGQLRDALAEEWENIPQVTIDNLVHSMRRRCLAVQQANGGHTRY